MRDSLRTQKIVKQYKQKHRKLGNTFRDVDLCKLKKVKKWKHWILVENEFPYDKIAQLHHMLVPLRKFPNEQDMTLEEWKELMNIKKSLEKDYNAFLENSANNRTVSKLFHLHCIKYLYIKKYEK